MVMKPVMNQVLHKIVLMGLIAVWFATLNANRLMGTPYSAAMGSPMAMKPVMSQVLHKTVPMALIVV